MLRVFALIATGGVALCGLGGCVAPVGESSVYSGSIAPTIAVSIPQNAYSISQQFRKSAESTDDHWGLDVNAPVGTPVLAAQKGVVIASFTGAMYGNRIEIRHAPDADGTTNKTTYLHLNKRLVQVGDHVAQGQKIGELGRTGVLAGGLAHLHFEVWRRHPGAFLLAEDPHLFWVGGIGKITCPPHPRGENKGVLQIVYPVACVGGG